MYRQAYEAAVWDMQNRWEKLSFPSKCQRYYAARILYFHKNVIHYIHKFVLYDNTERGRYD